MEQDRKAKKLPRASGFLESGYPAFWFARYRRLRPLPISGDPRSKLECESDYKTFSSLLSEWEERISSHPDGNRVLTDLNARLRQQLAALLLDTITDLENYRSRKKSANRLQKVANEAQRRTRVLVGKVAKIHSALEKLRKYAERIDPLLGREYALTAKSCLKQLTNLRMHDDPSADLRMLNETENETPKDPVNFAMVQLYCFFRHGCRVPGDEAEVRVGLLRNSFWWKYEIASVPIRTAYDSKTAESKGCDAVHQAFLRYSLRVVDQGTPR
jgi:hypothetical protein